MNDNASFAVSPRQSVPLFRVPRRDVMTIIEMGGYGISYWASTMRLSENDILVVYTHEEGVLRCEIELLATVLIELANGLHAVSDNIRQYAGYYLRDLQKGDEYAAGQIDATLADVIIQIALLGEVVYG